MHRLVENGVLTLHGIVGVDFTSADVNVALAEAGPDTPLEIRLSSFGGDAGEGLAIYSALIAHQGRKTMLLQGIAASAGSLIAMAGDEIIISRFALFMIHDAELYGIGGSAEDIRRHAQGLDTISEAYAKAYADRSGKPVDAIRQLMIAETWFSADEAIAEGFADRIAESAASPEPAAAAYALAHYRNPPQRLAALAEARGRTQEAPLKEDEIRADERKRIGAILSHSDATGREEFARHLAFATALPADEAAKMLAAAPKAGTTQEDALAAQRAAAASLAMPGSPGPLSAAALALPLASKPGQRAPLRWSDFTKESAR